jgi:hypothetical protein
MVFWVMCTVCHNPEHHNPHLCNHYSVLFMSNETLIFAQLCISVAQILLLTNHFVDIVKTRQVKSLDDRACVIFSNIMFMLCGTTGAQKYTVESVVSQFHNWNSASLLFLLCRITCPITWSLDYPVVSLSFPARFLSVFVMCLNHLSFLCESYYKNKGTF